MRAVAQSIQECDNFFSNLRILIYSDLHLFDQHLCIDAPELHNQFLQSTQIIVPLVPLVPLVSWW